MLKKCHYFLIPLFYLILWLQTPLTAATWEGSAEGGFGAKIQVAPESLHLLEGKLHVQIVLNMPPGHHVEPNEIRSHLLEGTKGDRAIWSLVDEKISPIEKDEMGQLQQRLQYTLEPWFAGQQSLSAHEIHFYGQGQEPVRTLYSDLFLVNVEGAPGQKKGSETIQDPIPLEGAPLVQLSEANRKEQLEDPLQRDEAKQRLEQLYSQNQLPWQMVRALFYFLLIGLLAWLGLKLSQRLTYKSVDEEVQDPRQEALDAVETLLQRKLPEQGLIEPFFVQLTLILRVFLEQQYQIQAPNQTTAEFLAKAMPLFSPATQKDLSHFLHVADLVKFAKESVDTQGCQDAARAARQFIAHAKKAPS